MIIVLVAVVALFVMLTVLLYLLVEFARVSRRDALFGPADSRSVRRTRRLAGMYVRGEYGTGYGAEESDARGGDEELVGR